MPYDKGKTIFGLVFVAALFIVAIFVSREIQDNTAVQQLVASFGHLGIFLVALIGGLNLFVPIPATAFIPIFSAAGFSLPIIIAIIVVGTSTADLASFYVGTYLKPKADKSKNKTLIWIREKCVGRPRFTQLVVFLYASFVPTPNELLLLPLGSLGVKLRSLLIPFVVGTSVHVTAVAYGLSLFI